MSLFEGLSGIDLEVEETTWSVTERISRVDLVVEEPMRSVTERMSGVSFEVEERTTWSVTERMSGTMADSVVQVSVFFDKVLVGGTGFWF